MDSQPFVWEKKFVNIINSFEMGRLSCVTWVSPMPSQEGGWKARVPERKFQDRNRSQEREKKKPCYWILSWRTESHQEFVSDLRRWGENKSKKAGYFLQPPKSTQHSGPVLDEL